MSIVSEVNRLKDAKTAIKTAIEGKGVTVPDATMLEGMAALIDSIEAGGGSSDYIIETGTITFAESYKPYSTPLVINHSLGEIPIVFFASNGTNGYYPKYQICYMLVADPKWSTLRSRYSGILYSTTAGSSNMGINYGNYITTSNSSITISGGTSSLDFNPSASSGYTSTLKWLAITQKA